MVARQATFSGTQKALVKGEEGLVDFKHVIAALLDKVFHDDVELAAAAEGIARPGKELPRLAYIQLQGYGEGQCRGFGGLIGGVIADLREVLAVHIGFFIDFGVYFLLQFFYTA